MQSPDLLLIIATFLIWLHMVLLPGREMIESASVNYIHSFPNIFGMTVTTAVCWALGNSNEQLQHAESLLLRA